MATYTAAQIYAYARAAGFTSDQAVTMTAVALAESGGNGMAHATRGEDSRGLWQINMNAHKQWAHLDASDPAVNARMAYEVSRQGRDISPWTVTHGGADARYLDYRAQAQRAAIEAGDAGAQGNWSGTEGYGHAVAAGGGGGGGGGDHTAGFAASGYSTYSAGTGGNGPGGAQVGETTRHFLDAALAQAGDRYVYGAEAQLNDADPDAFDCSELTQWAAAQAGVEIPDGAANQYEALRTEGQEVSVDEALRTPGALLFHADASGYVSHVAISLGDGRTIEARNSRLGVGVFDGRENWLNRAAVLPGLSGEVGAGAFAAGPGTGLGAGGTADATDSDADGLTDALEASLGSNAHEVDSDSDGLSDSYELLRVHSDVMSADTDHDGLADALDLASGFDPTNADSTGTGRLDGATGEAASLDTDDDGLADALERVLGTDSTLADSDHDGVTDGAEHLNRMDPLDLNDVGSLVHGADTGPGTGADLGALHPGGTDLDGTTHL
ncbi:glycoside hydrolase [Parafrankia soli]|uniref:Glycoside hydrolase n=1 Tax=Parafrankia soli TaxID=2599596 RepID=A0A1S1PWN3_9ACTN|nr:NlpC/P60 family protein [Parafrankia soli]OHV25726.1 glycoside hydrolase [Parafrankia soli]